MSVRARALRVAVLVASALLVLLAWDYAELFLADRPPRDGPPMLIVAHRGNMEVLPENSAEAIWDAARLAADGIEFDVHQSRDGTWWVIHDDTVDRTTDGSGAVRDLPDSVLSSLRINAGPGFTAGEHDALGLARLATVLDGLSDYEGRLYVDLQHAVNADPADLARQLVGRNATVICRSLRDAITIKETDPSIGTLIRIGRVGDDPPVDALFMEAFREVRVHTVAEVDLPVVTFIGGAYDFVGEEPMIRRAWAAGVDAFLSKRLAAAMALRDELVRDELVTEEQAGG